jgi:hypothetical protein
LSLVCVPGDQGAEAFSHRSHFITELAKAGSYGAKSIGCRRDRRHRGASTARRICRNGPADGRLRIIELRGPLFGLLVATDPHTVAIYVHPTEKAELCANVSVIFAAFEICAEIKKLT